MTELQALITLNLLPRIGPVRIRHLIRYFGSAEAALGAPREALEQVPRCGGEVAKVILNWERYGNAEQELERCAEGGVQVITPASPEWPVGLRDSRDAPVLLYVWGTIDERRDQSPVAVVGSRKMTNYGRSVTEQFTKSLASAGHTIISGLALGIDTIAHQAALEVGQPTIAVLGSGLGAIYPRENLDLAHRIAQCGAVVSEYPLSTNPDKQTFPQRNRIVAAWSRATLVTEMPERSGAMITARFARDLGRPLYAVPGPIDRPSSSGCHLLIREGATLVTDPNHLSQELRPQSEQLAFDLETPSASPSDLSPEEALVYSKLTSLEQSVEELHLATELEISELTSTLLSLELQDLALQHPGMTYTLV